MKTVKIAYNWIGPQGPIPNLNAPNIYDLASVMPGVHLLRDTKVDNLGSSFISSQDYDPEVSFEVVPFYTVKQDDLCILPIILDYDREIWDWFQVGRGIFEAGSHVGHVLYHYICSGNTYLLLDFSFETKLDSRTLRSMHDYFESWAFPMNKIIYATGCINNQEIYDRFCNHHGIPDEPDRRMHIITHYPGLQNMSGSSCNENPLALSGDSPEKKFLSFNYRTREHRTLLFGLFWKHNLLNDSFMSYVDLHGPITNHVPMHRIENFGLSMSDYAEIDKIVPAQLGAPRSEVDYIYDNENSDLEYYYSNSLVSIVTETTFFEDTHAITEKAFKPIKYMHPFIMVGSPGLLKRLQQMGFKTFSEWWDESYDLDLDHEKRMKRILDLCVEIQGWSDEQVVKFRNEVKEILEYNYHHMMSNPYNSCMYNQVYTIVTGS